MAELTKERIIEELKASTQNASGMFEIGEDTICALMSMLTNAAPQLPQPAVVSFDEWSRKCDLQIELCDRDFRDKAQYIWNACRAAMLQGAEPVSQPYTLPAGMVAVPLEPTENMIIAGFEAELREEFRDPEAWETFEAMSGCEQAAHRAKWCWAAMIAAAPQQGTK